MFNWKTKKDEERKPGVLIAAGKDTFSALETCFLREDYIVVNDKNISAENILDIAQEQAPDLIVITNEFAGDTGSETEKTTEVIAKLEMIPAVKSVLITDVKEDEEKMQFQKYCYGCGFYDIRYPNQDGKIEIKPLIKSSLDAIEKRNEMLIKIYSEDMARVSEEGSDEKVKELQETVNEVQTECERLKEALQEKETEIEKLRDNAATEETNAELEECRAEIKKLESEKERLKEQIENLQKNEGNIASEEIEALKEENEVLKEKNNELQNTLASAETGEVVAELEKELVQKAEEIEKLKEEKTELSEKIKVTESSEAGKTELEKKVEELEKELAEVKTTSNYEIEENLNNLINIEKKKVVLAEEKITILEKENELLKSENIFYAESIDKARMEAPGLKKNIEDLTKENSEKDARIEKLTSEKEEIEEKIVSLNEKITEAETKSEKAEYRNSKLEEKLNRIRSILE